jgi:hypothetical protein
MIRSELEEVLDRIFPGGFEIDKDSDGQLVILTGLLEDADEELYPMDIDDFEMDPDLSPDLSDED